MDDLVYICIFKIQGWIWENARPIIEERQELERVQAEAERNRASNQNDDYTSLYWDPEAAGGRAGAKSENEYEVKKKTTLIKLFFLLSWFLITFF